MICRYVADTNGELGYRCRQEGLLFYAHRSFETGKQAANIALLVECLLLALFYTYTALMRKDFTKAFVIITLAPFTLRAALLVIHTAIIHAMQFPDMQVIRGLRKSQGILETTGCFSFMLGSTIFAGTAINTARVRKPPKNWKVTSLPHMLVVFLMCTLATLDAFPPQFANFSYSSLSPLIFLAVLTGAAAVMIGLFIAIIITGTCCYKEKQESSSCDPVVVNARSRMFWTIPLMITAGIVVLTDLIGSLSTDRYLSTISMSTTPPFLVLSVFLLLPAYRTALFCCFANNRLLNKVSPTTIIVRPSSGSVDSSQKS